MKIDFEMNFTVSFIKRRESYDVIVNKGDFYKLSEVSLSLFYGPSLEVRAERSDLSVLILDCDFSVSRDKVCTHHPRSRRGRWFAEIVSVHPAQTSPWCHRVCGERSVVADFMGKSGGSEGGVGGLRSLTFELGEQTAKDWLNEKELTGVYDGLWQEPRMGPSGQHEPSPEGGRGAGLRASEIRGADSSPKLTDLLVPVSGTDARCKIFLAFGQEEDGETAVFALRRALRQTTQSHRSVDNGRRGLQFMCGTKGGGKPIGLAGALPRERTLSGNVYSLTEDDEKLIDLVKRYPPLYQVSSRSYKDSVAKNNIWIVIAKQMKRSADQHLWDKHKRKGRLKTKTRAWNHQERKMANRKVALKKYKCKDPPHQQKINKRKKF
ncbi:hypothetical protein GEV33_012063 [Tenebrio molitor]|uniref:MADF domain-containing protein n=1 Tax=Tenebrio molitor TaxID=7067 RepID=A0A8J6L9B3_TENMO|nr:hypothetical protein GEV33_012063 [Tenebrio molitor]